MGNCVSGSSRSRPVEIETRYSGIYSQSLSGSSEDQQTFNAEVNAHLDLVNSRPTGHQLLGALMDLSAQRRHKVTIQEVRPSRGGPGAFPVLSPWQSEADPHVTRPASLRAIKTGVEPNEGSSAVVDWTPLQTSMGLDEDGDPTGPVQSDRDKVSLLAHELIHARHMMAGTWKGTSTGRDSIDPNTAAGKEELRAVGLGKYKYENSEEPSENSIRAEHGLPKRVSYHPSGYRSE